MANEQLKSSIVNVSKLPPMSSAVQCVLRLLASQGSSNRDLAQAILYDPALTAKVLQIANSSYYGLPNRGGAPSRSPDVAHAVGVLGRNTLRSMVMAISSSALFRKPSANRHLDRQALWRHALGVAFLASRLARRDFDRQLAEQAFMAGLLHDIGKIVLDICCPEEYARTCEAAGGRPLIAAERELGPATHPEAGAMLARSWKLPEETIDAIRWHHEPAAAPEDATLPGLIHAANELWHWGEAGGEGEPAVHPAVAAGLELTPQACRAAIDSLHLEMQAANAFLSLGAA